MHIEELFPAGGAMLGAIVGDVVGSVFEFNPLQESWESFSLFSGKSKFTDDTVMTLAVADALMRGYGKDGLHDLFIDSMHTFGRARLTAGYGQRFLPLAYAAPA